MTTEGYDYTEGFEKKQNIAILKIFAFLPYLKYQFEN